VLVIGSGVLPRWLGWVSILGGIMFFVQGFGPLGNSHEHDPTPPGTGGSRERVGGGFDASQLGGWAVLPAVSRTGR
jgi:hypothetical protein